MAISLAKTKEGEIVFPRTKVPANEGLTKAGLWNEEEYGTLWKVVRPFSSKARGLKLEMGSYIAGPEELFLTFSDELMMVKKPEKKKDNETGKKTWPDVLVLKPIENWQEEEIKYVERVKSIRNAKQGNVIQLAKDMFHIQDRVSELKDMYDLMSSDIEEIKGDIVRLKSFVKTLVDKNTPNVKNDDAPKRKTRVKRK